jgi:hypothetical protein
MRSQFLIVTIIATFLARPVWAQNAPTPSSACQTPSELETENSDRNRSPQTVINDRTISEDGLTVPSLWWAKEQFDPFGGRLIDNWVAYPNQRLIDIVVNRQLWSLLNYMERYRFVNKFGTVARDYQYDLRIFDRQNKCLVTYSCNYSTNPNQCAIDFEPSGRTGLQVDNFTQSW